MDGCKLKQSNVLIFGGAGSLGKILLKRLYPDGHKLAIFSRDEAKHHQVSLLYPEVKCIIGDIRNYDSTAKAIHDFDPTIIINCSALKQVPTCEYYPFEAVQTNVVGAYNLVKAIENHYPVNSSLKVLSISTDKACKPVNSYGMTKALQERIHLNGNKRNGVFNCVRYGNMLESTGSVVPVFKKMLLEKKNYLPITHKSMTRFLLSLDQAVDLILVALSDLGVSGGKIFIPKVKAAKIIDLANCLMANSSNKYCPELKEIGIRPGEKINEILISEEELVRTEKYKDIYIIHDIDLNEQFNDLHKEYSSDDELMNYNELEKFLRKYKII